MYNVNRKPGLIEVGPIRHQMDYRIRYKYFVNSKEEVLVML